MRRLAERTAVRLSPLTRLIPERTRHAARDLVFRAVGKKPAAVWEPPLPFVPGQDPPGLNLFGFFRAENGLAQGVKLYARAAEEAGIPHDLLNTDFLYWLPQRDTEWDSRLSDRARYAVDLVHINPDQWADACACFPRSAFDGRYTIGVWLWELEKIPPHWADTLPYVNELWAPSGFIADALRKVTGLPVTVIPYGIEAETEPELSRRDFGLPEDAFLALAMFDSNSYASRKNPFGAIEAFRRAFPPEERDVRLVLKVSNPKRADLRRIRECLGGDDRCILITDAMPKRRLNTLISLCDAFVSLHRAEGFGLVMAEAMSLGVAVVATAWSANMDYMTPETACLVDAALIPVGEDYQFGAGQRWADPDPEQAADFLRRLRDDPRWREALGRRAAAHIREHLSVRQTGELMRRRLDGILASRPLP